MSWVDGGLRLLSVVVIGRNEGRRLERCLRSVQAMVADGFNVETIYVDSGSTDGSLVLARRLGATSIALEAARPTAAMGRNAGWRAARGEVVLFLDGDTVLERRFVADSLPDLEQPGVAVVWGHRREMFPERSAYVRVMDLDWVYAPGWTAFCGGDALFCRAALQRSGGFDETLIAGEEPELCRRLVRLSLRILHVDRPMTRHDLAITRLRQYWRRATRAGHAYAEVSARFAGTDDPFWTADALRNQVHGAVLIGGATAALVAAGVLHNLWPLAVAGGGLLALAVRSAWKARWKGGDGRASRATLLLYGLHSHLQQVPILAGQLGFWWQRGRGKRASLVEYK